MADKINSMVFITKKDYDRIIRYCIGKLPEEACGLLAGVKTDGSRLIKKVYLLSNADKSSTHFSIDIREQLAAVKDMRANGYIMLGNFHSHPAAPAVLSEEDKRLAYSLDTDYIVISLMDIKKPVLNAYNIGKEKNITKTEVIITE